MGPLVGTMIWRVLSTGAELASTPSKMQLLTPDTAKSMYPNCSGIPGFWDREAMRLSDSLEPKDEVIEVPIKPEKPGAPKKSEQSGKPAKQPEKSDPVPKKEEHEEK